MTQTDVQGGDEEELDAPGDDKEEDVNDVLAAAKAASPAPEKEKSESGGGLDNLLDDLYDEEPEDDEHMKAFGDLEHLTMVEVSSEVEAVLEELRIRQGDND